MTVLSHLYRVAVQVLDSAGEEGSLPHHHADVPVDLHEGRLLHLLHLEGGEHGELVVRLILPVPGIGLRVRVTCQDISRLQTSI